MSEPDAPFDQTCDDAGRSSCATELDGRRRFVLLYAYNGTGKTRLSMAFKDLGKSKTADDARTRSTSMPSPKTCSSGTTILKATASVC